MKKSALILGIFIFALMLILPIAPAEDNLTKIDNAYGCVRDKIGNCTSSALSLEQKIFSLLVLDSCQNQMISESKKDSENNSQCWPNPGCNVKKTAQTVLALNRLGVSTTSAEAWLLSKNHTPAQLTWYLQIESSEAAMCRIDYDDFSYAVNISEDKIINYDAGDCLNLAYDDYWLEINPECYNKEFAISCDKGFLTTLLFKKDGSSTIHISEESNTESADGTTLEKVNSFCFGSSSSCNYEETLWAALVLDSLGYDITSNLPYLITMADNNLRLLPESFLYILTDYEDFRTELLGRQKSNKWWMESPDKYYDTAVALLPFSNERIQEKTNSKDWLFNEQKNNGCFENPRDTAFLLYSVWTEGIRAGETNGGGENGSGGNGGGGVGFIDCEAAGYDCMSPINCQGNELNSYTPSCRGSYICCDTPAEFPVTSENCASQGGEICNSNQNCVGGTTADVPDTSYGETCCIGGGVCETLPPVIDESECELAGGICRSYGCGDDEEENSESCDFSGDSCCVEKTFDGKSFLWVWILAILIIFAILGIVFKDKLKILIMRFKGKGHPRQRPRPGFPPSSMRPDFQRRAMPRKILPPATSSQQRRMPQTAQSVQVKPKGELNDVLRKLKDMSK